MNIEDLRVYCLTIKGSEECMPFDDTVLVFKVMGKMFAFLGLEPHIDGFIINLKCDPEKAIELREKYDYIVPGYHSNKKYWNSIYFEKGISDELLRQLINHSVDEVIKKLPKKAQEEYKNMKTNDI